MRAAALKMTPPGLTVSASEAGRTITGGLSWQAGWRDCRKRLEARFERGQIRGMYKFDIDKHGAKATLYADLSAALAALTADEPDAVANMANAAALIWEYVPDLNWAGFYRAVGQELVLGPFQGKTACIRIPFGKGVCGTAADTRAPLCIADVHEFPGHIACDAYSASELVVPIVHEGHLIGVLDLDSPVRGRFDEEDVIGCSELMAVLGPRIVGPAT